MVVKRISSLMLAIALIFPLVGCGDGYETDTTAAPDASTDNLDLNDVPEDEELNKDGETIEGEIEEEIDEEDVTEIEP